MVSPSGELGAASTAYWCFYSVATLLLMFVLWRDTEAKFSIYTLSFKVFYYRESNSDLFFRHRNEEKGDQLCTT